jgi:hypothetical protein
MRPAVSVLSSLLTLLTAASLTGCDGCRGQDIPSEAERTKMFASAIASSGAAPLPSSGRGAADSIGHPANVIPGQGPKRITSDAPRMGPAYPILPGQGVGPVRFGANRQTIERLMGAPCEDASESLCRYLGRGLDFKLEGGLTKEIRISRKGREAKRAPDGSIVEYGFFNGAIRPDLYFGMQPGAIQEHLGAPQKIEKIEPMGADGFAERHVYDGITLEYDAWSNGKLVLGAVILTKSESAAIANEKAEAERTKRAAELEKLKPKAKTPPTRDPR